MTAIAATEVDLSLPCQDVDPDIFFADQPAEIELAKEVCLGCPLRRECLAGALERGEPHGVWGGELFQDGLVIAQKRRRGRPRKNPQPLLAEPVRAA
ncbi:MAG: WhiB family transcriptional regulator [Propionibacteriaceae bacterium]|nr:WhiB family transcriptional regulator [Propionibacteriaceae bacterium]